MLDTFVRYAAVSLRWALGERAHRLTSVFAGLLPDLVADSFRQVMRWSLPLFDTPVDAIPYLMQHYGLPPYDETYARSMARLRSFLDTHVNAGAEAMLIAEAEAAGFPAGTISIEPLPGIGAFAIVYTEADGVPHTFGDGTKYGDGTLYYYQISKTEAHNVRRLIEYFKPARDLFAGVKGP